MTRHWMMVHSEAGSAKIGNEPLLVIHGIERRKKRGGLGIVGSELCFKESACRAT